MAVSNQARFLKGEPDLAPTELSRDGTATSTCATSPPKDLASRPTYSCISSFYQSSPFCLPISPQILLPLRGWIHDNVEMA